VKFTQLLNRTGSTMLNTLSKEGKLRADLQNVPASAITHRPVWA
jgi:hypothetical protein